MDDETVRALLSHLVRRVGLEEHPLDRGGTGAGASRDDVATRILDAALGCVAEVGVTKTTLDDVARAAGCSRATLYRYFPGKRPLLAAAVAREAERLQTDLVDAAAQEASLDTVLVALVTTAARTLAAHQALATVLAVEPEVVLAHLAFGNGDAVWSRAGRLAVPVLDGYLPADRAARAGEWLARLVVSFLTSPSEWVDPTDPASVRALVHDFVLPGLPAPTTTNWGNQP